MRSRIVIVGAALSLLCIPIILINVPVIVPPKEKKEKSVVVAYEPTSSGYQLLLAPKRLKLDFR
jgi:hypothetical protein